MGYVMKHIYIRADFECELCHRIMGLQEHHIVKRSQCGTDRIENRILLCWYCHHSTKGIHGRDGKELDRQLKVGLQQYYEWLEETNIKSLMGGRLYPGELYLPLVIKHFEKLKSSHKKGEGNG